MWDIDPADRGPLIDKFLNEEQRQLFAELRHDYGLRHMEERRVRYEDEGSRLVEEPGAPLTPTQQQGPQGMSMSYGDMRDEAASRRNEHRDRGGISR